jgi:hypothetical protein
VELPQDLKSLRDILEIAERAKEVQRQVKGRWSVEVPHVLLHELRGKLLSSWCSPGSTLPHLL